MASPTPQPMPELQPSDVLELVPSDPAWRGLRGALSILKRDFPEIYARLTPERVQSFLTKDPDDARDDIFQYMITAEGLMETYGWTAQEAQQVILGANEGGTNFNAMDVPPRSPTGNAPGGGGTPPMRIMGSANLQWYKDPKTGKYYASYTLPGTNQQILFEANAAQMKELFAGRLPETSNINFNQAIRNPNMHFGGSITEVEGQGSFDAEYRRVVSLALDQRDLPAWMKNDPAAMALLFVATSENRSDEWFYDQLSHLKSFEQRYPHLNKLISSGLNAAEAVKSFHQYEHALKQLHAGAGFNPAAINPNIVGTLLSKNYSIDQVSETYQIWGRIHANQTALKAFNEILVANGQAALRGKTMYQFLMGSAPANLYKIWEGSAINEAAEAMGFGGVFGGADALKLAVRTEGTITQDMAFKAFQNVAQQALRLRHELNLGQYGVDIDDLIDLSFGQAPRSGKNVAQVQDALQRIQQEAQGFQAARVNPFIQFSDEGRPKAVSFGEARKVT